MTSYQDRRLAKRLEDPVFHDAYYAARHQIDLAEAKTRQLRRENYVLLLYFVFGVVIGIILSLIWL